jgi:hypothetical protein
LLAQEKKDTTATPSQTQVVDFSKGSVVKKTQTSKQPQKSTATAEKKDTKPQTDALPYHNTVQLELLTFPFGYMSASYEREVAPKITLEAGVGVTFTGFLNNVPEQFFYNSFGKNALNTNEYWQEKGNQYQDYADPLFVDAGGNFVSASAYQKTGTYLMGEAKYFYQYDAFDGLFMSLRGQYLRFNYAIPQFEPTTNGTPTVVRTITDASQEYTDIVGGIGWRREFLNDRLILTNGFGLGARMVKISAPDSGFYFDNNTNTYIQETRFLERNMVLPMFSYTVKLGFLF